MEEQKQLRSLILRLENFINYFI